MKKRIFLVIAMVLCAFFSIVAQQAKNPKVKGVASYYSDRLHGRLMANGEKYDRDSFTCAHLRYPFGTMLKVRNLSNKKECVVRVTDRGPYSRKFTIDLSRAAAKHLGILGVGFAQVEITPYYSGRVPYRFLPEELVEVPELTIEYMPAAVYPDPVWMSDSTAKAGTTVRQPSDKQRQPGKDGTAPQSAGHKPAAKGLEMPYSPKASQNRHRAAGR